MHTFLGLPNEILIKIVEVLQCEDIESVTLSCKHIRRLAPKVLSEHLSRKRRFTTVAVGEIRNLTWDEDAQIRGIHPIVALRDFVLDEESALYPRTLIVGYMEEEYSGSNALDEEEGQIADSDLADIVAQLGNRLLPKVLEVTRVLRLDTEWTKDWARNWTPRIVSGNVEAAACLLIALLPNLVKLRVVDGWRYYRSPPFYSVINRILKAAKDSQRDLTGMNSFKNLSEVGLHGTDDGCGLDFHFGPEFRALPSIRTIKGRCIDGETQSSESVYKPGPPFVPDSNITTLEYYQSSIDMGSFYDCIESIKSLQKFTYDFRAAAAVGDQTWEPRGTVGVLQKFACRSLVHLELTGVTDIYSVKFRRGEPFIGTLRAFEVLETLRLESVMLYKEVEGTDDEPQDERPHNFTRGFHGDYPEITEDDWAGGRKSLVEPERLVDILPASAKRLRLVGCLSDEEATEMLADLVELKDERIPKLRRIFFEDVDPSSEVSSVCEKACVKARFCERV